MRIHILSDLHIEFALLHPPETDADVVVLAGDIGVGKKGVRRALQAFRGKPVVLVIGNHEAYGSNLQSVMREIRTLAGSDVHVLENDAVTIDGVRFLGCTLWTDFRLFGEVGQACVMGEVGRKMNDYVNISWRDAQGKRKMAPDDTRLLHQQSRHWLENELAAPFAGQTVVVTHHAPHPNSLRPEYANDPLSAAYVSDLSPLMGQMALWIHGHIHRSMDYVVNGTRVVCNPRGYHRYEPNPGFRPGWVVEI